MNNGTGRIWAVNANGGDEGRPNGVGPVYIENIDKIGGGVPDPSGASTGDVLTVDAQGNPAWEPPTGGGATYTAGNGIEIENNQISVDTDVVATKSDLPDMSDYATESELTAGLATKQDVIDDLSTIRSGAAAGSTAVQPAALDDYATTTALTEGLSAKQDVISDLSTIRSGAQAGATAVQPAALDDYATTSALTSGLSAKQDVIDDLSTIRSGAALGSTAVQPAALNDYATTSALTSGLATKQDTIDDLSTIRSGAALGATAVQPASLDNYATTSALASGLAAKQDTLTAGSNITISNGTISAVDTTYTAGANITIENGVISATDGDTRYTAGNGIDIDANNEISVKVDGRTILNNMDGEGLVGLAIADGSLAIRAGGVAVTNPVPSSTSSDANKVLTVNSSGEPEWAVAQGGTVDQTYNASSTNAQSGTAVAGAIATKQDILTAGRGITISNNVISSNDSVFYAERDVTTFSEISAAVNAGKTVYAMNTGSDPASTAYLFWLDSIIRNGSNGTAVFMRMRDDNTSYYNGYDAIRCVHNENLSPADQWIEDVNIGSGLPVPDGENKTLVTDSYGAAVWTNTPDLSVYATTSAMNTALAGKQASLEETDTIELTGTGNVHPGVRLTTSKSTGENISFLNADTDTQDHTAGISLDFVKVQSELTPYFVSPSDLATVATSGDYDDLINKPDIPATKPVVAGSNVTITENANDITISATDTTYSAGTGISISSGTISNSDPLPSHSSTESGKVLGVDSNGDLGWVNQSGGGSSYVAGTGIDITGDTISVDTTVVATQSDLSNYTPTANLATVATTGDYDDLTGTPATTALVAGTNVTITESANNLTISATDTTYSAGDGIDITSGEISVAYNQNTLDVAATSTEASISSVNAHALNIALPSDVSSMVSSLMTGGSSVTMTIPADSLTFFRDLGLDAFLMFSTGSIPSVNDSVILKAPLAYSERTEEGVSLDGQTVTLPVVDSTNWYIGSNVTTPSQFESMAIMFGTGDGSSVSINMGNGFSSESSTLDPPLTFTQLGAPLLTVSNPLPASAVGDAGKVLTVNSSGNAIWATPSGGGSNVEIIDVTTSTVAQTLWNTVMNAYNAGKLVVLRTNYELSAVQNKCRYWVLSMYDNLEPPKVTFHFENNEIVPSGDALSYMHREYKLINIGSDYLTSCMEYQIATNVSETGFNPFTA